MKKRDSKKKYEKIKNADEEDIKYLMKLDEESERLFDKQATKKHKNEDMIGNKINDLNEKPMLRDYLFKHVSNQQLEKDIQKI